MNSHIENHISDIEKLSEKFSVEKLYLFGSAGTDHFNKESDIDFLVSFQEDIPLGNFADNYFDFHDRLEAMLKREVDLITEKSIKNPYLARSINSTKKIIYDRESQKVSL